MKYFQKWLKNNLQKPTYQANYTKKGQIGIDWLIASFGFETTILWRIYDGIEADTVRVRKIGFEFPISELWQAAGSLMSQIWSFRDQTPRLRIVFTSVPTALRPCFLFLFTRAFYSKRVGYRERVDIQIFLDVVHCRVECCLNTRRHTWAFIVTCCSTQTLHKIIKLKRFFYEIFFFSWLKQKIPSHMEWLKRRYGK